MNRRHFLATALAAPLAAGAVPAPAPAPAPVLFDRIIEPAPIKGWRVEYRQVQTGRMAEFMGFTRETYARHCATVDPRYPFPEWSKMIRYRVAYPLPDVGWTPISPS